MVGRVLSRGNEAVDAKIIIVVLTGTANVFK